MNTGTGTRAGTETMRAAAGVVVVPHPMVQGVPLLHPAHLQPHTPVEHSTECIVVADSPPIL